jgi:membrane-bound lytic murein transglycosylase B
MHLLRKSVCTFLILLFADIAVAEDELRHPEMKGWDHLLAAMIGAGMPEETALKLIGDKRFPVFDFITFKVKPKENPAPYARLNTPENRQNALNFYRQYESSFHKAEAEFGVPKSVILAIIQVETGCGKNFGKHPVLIRLARFVGLGDPQNIVRNFEENNPDNFSLSEFKKRAKYMEETFLPHLVATSSVAHKMGIDPFELKGSIAGAIGYPQFLPGNVDKFGVDGNNDGHINMFEPEDAVPSVGKYLANHGWHRGRITTKEKRSAIRGYNGSEPYIDTVLEMARDFDRIFAGSKRPLRKTRPKK